MRCKKHYTDLSSTIGVCACCLRERLLHVVATQEQTLAQLQIQNRNSENIPANIPSNSAFPRSVSPHINNRKRNQSDGATISGNNNRIPFPSSAPRHRHSISEQLFFHTPESDPTSTGQFTVNAAVDLNNNLNNKSNKKRSFIRFFSFANIFRSRNRKSVDTVTDRVPSDPTFRRHCGGDEYTGGALRRPVCRDRGMSPVRNADTGEIDEDESNIESTATESWKNTPRRTPARRGGGGGHGRSVSGLTFCMSPLVRASPNRQWSQKGLTPEVVFSGEIRVPVKAHLSNVKSFQANRSRKLADFGRNNLNR